MELRLPNEGFAPLLDQVNEANSPLERLAAARAIANAALTGEQLNRVIGVLPDANPTELPVLIESLELAVRGDAELSERFAKAHEAAAPALAQLKSSDSQVSERVGMLSETLPEGNVQHGKAIFFSNRAACSACHTVNGEGGDAGPDLSQIGAIRRRPDLLEAILYPSSSIVNSFETYSVLTADGRIVQGVIQHTDSRWLVLRDAQRREIMIEPREIEELKRSDTSIMPQGLEANLSSEDLADLLAYLESLGRDESRAADK